MRLFDEWLRGLLNSPMLVCGLHAQVPAKGEQPVLLLVDTAGCGMEEVAEEGGDSTSNPGEAQVGSGASR